MLSLNDKISLRQLQALLVLDILGAGVIVLPRRAAMFAGQDGWLIIVAATGLAMVAMFLIASVGRQCPDKSFVELCARLLSKPVAVLFALGFVVKILIGIAMEIRFFTEIIKQTMLPNTPFFIIYTTILLLSAYAAAKGYETRARMAEVLLPIVFIPLGIVFAFAAMDVDFTNLMPVFSTPAKTLGWGALFSGLSFTGIEYVLLVYPYLQRPKHARNSAVVAVGIIGAVMTLITLVTIAKFGPLEVQRQMWPVLEMMDVTDFPGSFIERQDALIISFWIVSVFAMVNAGLFFSSLLLKDVFNKGRHSMYIIICIPLVLLLTALPQNMGQVWRIMDVVYITFGAVYMVGLPVLLVLMAKIRGVDRR